MASASDGPRKFVAIDAQTGKLWDAGSFMRDLAAEVAAGPPDDSLTYNVIALTPNGGIAKGWGVGRPHFVWSFGEAALKQGRRVALWPADPEISNYEAAKKYARRVLGFPRRKTR